MTASIKASADGTQAIIQVAGVDRLTLDNSGNITAAGTMSGGSATGFRNKIINGGFSVNQRGALALSASATYAADRWTTRYIGTSGSGTVTVGSGSVKTRSAMSVSSLVLTSAYVLITQRVEAQNAKCLGGGYVTFSVKIYHDFGTPTNFNIYLQKPAAVDNWTISNTQIGSTITVSCASGAYTTVTGTWLLANAEADNGLECLISHDATTVTGKTIAYAEAQLEEGSIATPLEQRPYGLELSLCQRYYEIGAVDTVSQGTATYAGQFVSYTSSKRSAPTVTIYDRAGNAGKLTIDGVHNNAALTVSYTNGARIGLNNVAVGPSQFLGGTWTASAEL